MTSKPNVVLTSLTRLDPRSGEQEWVNFAANGPIVTVSRWFESGLSWEVEDTREDARGFYRELWADGYRP